MHWYIQIGTGKNGTAGECPNRCLYTTGLLTASDLLRARTADLQGARRGRAGQGRQREDDGVALALRRDLTQMHGKRGPEVSQTMF